MASKADLRDRVLHLLLSTEVSKVEFTLDGVKIDANSFSQVAQAIRDKVVNGKGGIGFRMPKMRVTRDAGYSPRDDVFNVPSWDYGTDRYQRQALVHESIHAYLDIISSNTTALTDEALAYVGATLFHIHATTAGGTPTAPYWVSIKIYEEAFRIASALFTSGSTTVSAVDAKSMRDAIAADKAYALLNADPTIQYGNNGLK